MKYCGRIKVLKFKYFFNKEQNRKEPSQQFFSQGSKVAKKIFENPLSIVCIPLSLPPQLVLSLPSKAFVMEGLDASRCQSFGW